MWWECSECGAQLERVRRPVGCPECGTAGVIFVRTDTREPVTADDDRCAAWLQSGLQLARAAVDVSPLTP